MATNAQGVLELQAGIQAVCNNMKTSFNNAIAVLSQNTVDAVDWNNLDTHPNASDILDADGYIQGTKYTGTDVANAINAITQVNELYTGGGATIGPWGELMEKLSRAL